VRRALPLLLVLTACSSLGTLPPAWLNTPAPASRIRAITLDANGAVTPAALLPLAAGPVSIVENRLVRNGKPLTEPFTAIDSFDYSERRDEVVFSAKREGGFDIGLAAGDGSQTNWAPADPADEVMVEWAPKGFKVSYVVRATHGDVVRALHIPTSYQYANDFGPATIHDVAWDPAGEKYAVAYSTLDASDRVEVLHFNGSQRRVAIPPAQKLAVDIVSFAPGAYALRPRDLRYNEKLPVVVWVAERFDWSDARAALIRDARVAVIVARSDDAAVRKGIGETPWMDATRLWVVGGDARQASACRPGSRSPHAEACPSFIVADASVPPGRYRREGSVLAVAPAAIQSVAAGFIADQLKRNLSTNGSSR